MSGIRTNAAAELLGVSPNTLRSWERRFGYPKPRRTQGGHRQYDLAELESLRRALLETHNISSAIELARQRGEGPSSPSRLLDAFDHFDEQLADRIMEESLAVRSVERTVEEVLLPAIEQADERERPRGRARARAPLGHRLAARQPARGGAGDPPAGRAPVRLEPAARRRVAPRAGARAGPAPRRLPHAAARLRPPARARRARHPRARPGRLRVLRRRGHARRGRPARLHGPPGGLRGAGVRVPRGHAGHGRPRHPVARLDAGRGRRAAEGLRGQRPHRAGRRRAGARGGAGRAHRRRRAATRPRRRASGRAPRRSASRTRPGSRTPP